MLTMSIHIARQKADVAWLRPLNSWIRRPLLAYNQWQQLSNKLRYAYHILDIHNIRLCGARGDLDRHARTSTQPSAQAQPDSKASTADRTGEAE
jgi:hypothetical protein